MIISTELLSVGDNRFKTYCGAAYTGSVIGVENGVVNDKTAYVDGVAAGEFIPPFPLIKSNGKEVDFSYLKDRAAVNDWEEPEKIFSGEKFTGVAYEFREGLVVNVYQFVDGVEYSKASYGSSGSLVFLEHDEIDESRWQKYYWYEGGGRLKSASLYSEKLHQVYLHFSEENKVTLLTLDENFLACGEAEKSWLIYDCFPTVNSFSYSLSKKVDLSGRGISDSEVNLLINAESFNDVEELDVSNARISLQSLVNICQQCQSLKDLRVQSKTLTYSEMQIVKKQLPNCNIWHNFNEVTV